MKYGCGTENKKEEMIVINTRTQKPTSVRKPGQSSQEFLSVQSTSLRYPSIEYVSVFYRVLQSFTSHAVFEWSIHSNTLIHIKKSHSSSFDMQNDLFLTQNIRKSFYGMVDLGLHISSLGENIWFTSFILLTSFQ